MSANEDDASRKKPDSADALKRRLRNLMGEDALAFLDLDLPQREGRTASQQRQAARTAR